jgi:hypothetical protein
MSDKKKRDFGDPIFHCFVALSVADTVTLLRTVETNPDINYVRINDSDDFHYFMLQYSEHGEVSERLLGVVNRWAQSDVTSVHLFVFNLYLYETLFLSLATQREIETYQHIGKQQNLDVLHPLTVSEKILLEAIKKVLPEVE